MTFPELVGYIPAFIFPFASILQLAHLYRTKSVTGVSLPSWIAFALGNLSLYIYTEKYSDLQAIIALLGTVCIQMGIIALILVYRKKERTPKAANA